jgi:uncharacterized protein with HEPN domain
MKAEILAHLNDILNAAQAVRGFVSGRTFDDYSSNELIRSAVERKFEVMGEALNRIGHEEPEILTHIRNHRDIISFRNILIHGYESIDDKVVWGVIDEDLDNLITDVNKLLR